MGFRFIATKILRRTGPLMFSTFSMFTNPEPPKAPTEDQKLKIEPLDMQKLSYDYMIKQSTIETVNSTTNALTVTYTAIESTSKEYRLLLTKLIMLINETLLREVSDTHWAMIVEMRASVQEKKAILNQFIGYMEYVRKMAEATSEITYLAGMDNLSSSLTIRIDDAMNKIEKEKHNTQDLEQEYVKVQQESIKKTKERKENPKENSNENVHENIGGDVQIINID